MSVAWRLTNAPFCGLQLGFRTKTVDFVEYWTFNPDLLSPSAKGVEKGGRITFAELLRIGHDCLEQKIIVINERSVHDCVSSLNLGCGD